MAAKQGSFLQGISGGAVAVIISVLLIFHVLALVIYIDYVKGLQRSYNRNKSIQQVINITHMMNATERDEQVKALKAAIGPNIRVTLTDTPVLPIQFEDKFTFSHIDSTVPAHAREPKGSVRLNNGRWLNFYITTHPSYGLFIIFLLLLELIVASAIIFSGWAISRFTKPLKGFRDAAETLGIDLKASPLVPYGPPAIRQATMALNRMQQRIQELIRDRTQMLAAISHDLRTPITRLKLRAQFIQDQEQQDKTINDLDEMEQMLQQTLDFARADSTEEQKTTLDLSSLVASICDDTQEVGHNIEYTGALKGIPFHARPLALKRAISNLVGNAVKFGDEVKVTLKSTKNTIVLTIDDNGPGIPENEIKKVFSPYYRAGLQTASIKAGVGLGLSIAREIFWAHGGSIELCNLEPQGLRVLVQFKRTPADQ